MVIIIKDSGDRRAEPIWEVGIIECADVIVWKSFVSNAGKNIMILAYPNMQYHIMLTQNYIIEVANLYPEIIIKKSDGSFTADSKAILKCFCRKSRRIQRC